MLVGGAVTPEFIRGVSAGMLLAALNNWLKPVQDDGGGYHTDSMAVKEILRVQTEALVVEGQSSLF